MAEGQSTNDRLALICMNFGAKYVYLMTLCEA